MPPTCGCKPGTPENGWHEIRSEECIAAEREAFKKALDSLPNIISKIRKQVKA